jgi:hypothetical protein
LSEIASEYGIHPEQAERWANQFIASAHKVFEKPDSVKEKELKKDLDKAYKKIGELEVELDFLRGGGGKEVWGADTSGIRI